MILFFDTTFQRFIKGNLHVMLTPIEGSKRKQESIGQLYHKTTNGKEKIDIYSWNSIKIPIKAMSTVVAAIPLHCHLNKGIEGRF